MTKKSDRLPPISFTISVFLGSLLPVQAQTTDPQFLATRDQSCKVAGLTVVEKGGLLQGTYESVTHDATGTVFPGSLGGFEGAFKVQVCGVTQDGVTVAYTTGLRGQDSRCWASMSVTLRNANGSTPARQIADMQTKWNNQANLVFENKPSLGQRKLKRANGKTASATTLTLAIKDQNGTFENGLLGYQIGNRSVFVERQAMVNPTCNDVIQGLVKDFYREFRWP